MRPDAFLKRLRAELPQWIERGWVDARHHGAILEHAAQRARQAPRHVPLVLALMGALLFGAGVIAFFAANWGVIPKLFKLTLLFGALAASYGASAFAFARGHVAFGHGLVLLGVALFGAGIFLIAQIYHIDAHYPDGVLWWALGALAAAGLATSQPALVAALTLLLVWSATETFAFGRNPHGWFLLPWLAAAALIWRRRWLAALRVACWSLLGWFLLLALADDIFDRGWIAGERMALWQLYVFAGLALYIVARGLSWSPSWSRYTPPLVTAGAVWAVTALLVLSFPRLHRIGVSAGFEPLLSSTWLVLTVVLLLLIAGLMAWRYHDTEIVSLPWYRRGAFVWLVLAGALAVANVALAGEFGGWAALGYNVLAFAGAVWLVLTGVERRELRLVNLGFVFFAVLLLARYVDTFWTLLDRSWFFMLGGAALLAGGLVLERSRRRLTAGIAVDDTTRT